MPNRSRSTTTTEVGNLLSTTSAVPQVARENQELDAAPDGWATLGHWDVYDFGKDITHSPESDNLPRAVARKVCMACRERRALFRYRGKVRFNKHHDLCFQCYRAAMDRLAAEQLASDDGIAGWLAHWQV